MYVVEASEKVYVGFRIVVVSAATSTVLTVNFVVDAEEPDEETPVLLLDVTPVTDGELVAAATVLETAAGVTEEVVAILVLEVTAATAEVVTAAEAAVPVPATDPTSVWM
ncbi:hypothetical protein WICPIJ_009131 [Wickerhamomyces pijperi]|uniref:Uncharacterized protein n=1 Tax=Wickerhamomyces pijperi TaxID=599730 RepID=A0A9P8TEX5_WICPI|nr:hypothetical protein WICPIJ_009131 [Wickerhamomyces pijperi]